MTRTMIFSAVALLAAAAPVAAAEAESDVALVLVVDAQYTISHGWGHVFTCTVKEVVFGELPDETVSVSVYGTVDLYGGLLAPFEEYENLVMGFVRSPDRTYGPPPGFRDEAGSYWELISVRETPAGDNGD
ncbi:MAG: hypothetical protein PVH29_00875 [Candidatus Zixiibacteriota bacterium]